MSNIPIINETIYNRFEQYFNCFLLGCCGVKIVHHFRTDSFKDIKSFTRRLSKKITSSSSTRININYHNFKIENRYFLSADNFYYEMVAQNGYTLHIDHTNFYYLKHWCDNIKTNSTLSLYWG